MKKTIAILLLSPAITFARIPAQQEAFTPQEPSFTPKEEPSTHQENTFRGEPITPELLASKKIREEFPIPDDVAACVKENAPMLVQLSSTPHPLSYQELIKKVIANKQLIQEKGSAGIVKDLSTHNYVLLFAEHPDHVIRVNHFASRVLCWMVSIGENIFTSGVSYKTASYDKFEHKPMCQGMSPFTHFLAWQEFERTYGELSNITTPATYLVPIPKAPDDNIHTMYPPASDENYVVAQKKVDGFQEFKSLSEEQQKKVVKAWDKKTIKQLFAITVYAGLWDMRNNVGLIDNNPNKLCMLDLEQSIFHSARFTHYQGDEGEELYARDTYMGHLRMAQLLLQHDHQKFEQWKKLYNKNARLKALHKKHKDLLKESECYISLKNEEALRTAKLYK